MCEKPITLRVDGSFYKRTRSILVPCGKCPQCLAVYQNNWYIRFLWESKRHKSMVFFTLTYAPENVPVLVSEDGEVFNTVYKKHVQDWLKRSRHLVSKPFKYFITSEYGPSTLRPHYHGIFFGLSLSDCKDIFRDWQLKFGYTTQRSINMLDKKTVDCSLRYLSKYCSKGEMENPNVKDSKVFPTFHLMSKGIGSNYVDELKAWHLKGLQKEFNGKIYVYTDESLKKIAGRNYVNLDNFNYSLPRYLKEKIYGKGLLSSQVSDALLAVSDAVCDNKLQLLQTQNPTDSPYRLLDVQNRRENIEKSNKINKQNARFYNKSKL